MSWCHQSQISEWLPWVGRHDMRPPQSLADWKTILRRRFARKNRELQLPAERATEVFTVTAWGELPAYETLLNDFPARLPSQQNLDRLKSRLRQWTNKG